MSGHSKWSSIKHQKGIADAKRGQIFTKLAHTLTVAARQGGGDQLMNPRLAIAVEMAKKNNMPKENIDRAIKRGTGELGGAAVAELTFEGYGPAGAAIYIEAVTDNRNRTAAEVRAVFTKHGGRLGEPGSVAYLFRRRGVIAIKAQDSSIEEIELAIIDSGADDYEPAGQDFLVYTDPKNLHAAKDKLEKASLIIESAEISFEPVQTVSITNPKTAGQIMRLLDSLEELDDISQVASNVDIDDSVLDQLS